MAKLVLNQPYYIGSGIDSSELLLHDLTLKAVI